LATTSLVFWLSDAYTVRYFFSFHVFLYLERFQKSKRIFYLGSLKTDHFQQSITRLLCSQYSKSSCPLLFCITHPPKNPTPNSAWLESNIMIFPVLCIFLEGAFKCETKISPVNQHILFVYCRWWFLSGVIMRFYFLQEMGNKTSTNGCNSSEWLSNRQPWKLIWLLVNCIIQQWHQQ
jgi:hypothetical protein